MNRPANHAAAWLVKVSIPVVLQNFFAHGQLYVALSRVSDKKNLRIYKPTDEETQDDQTLINTVYKEVLRCKCKKCKSKN